MLFRKLFFFPCTVDPPKIDTDILQKFKKPVIIKAGESAEWRMALSGGVPMNIQWYKDDDKLLPAQNVNIETSSTDSRLHLTKCQRKDSGEVKVKIKNEFGTTEAIAELVVLGESTIGVKLVMYYTTVEDKCVLLL